MTTTTRTLADVQPGESTYGARHDAATRASNDAWRKAIEQHARNLESLPTAAWERLPLEQLQRIAAWLAAATES